MDSHYMQGLDWAILGIYFAVLIAIGIWASMKRKKEPCGEPMSARPC